MEAKSPYDQTLTWSFSRFVFAAFHKARNVQSKIWNAKKKLSNDMLFVLNGQIERLKELSKDILFVLNGQIERLWRHLRN